jgi:hypothetical protein
MKTYRDFPFANKFNFIEISFYSILIPFSERKGLTMLKCMFVCLSVQANQNWAIVFQRKITSSMVLQHTDQAQGDVQSDFEELRVQPMRFL